MSERVLKFLLSELKVMRVVCPTCKGVVEVSIDKAPAAFIQTGCRLCEAGLGIPLGNNYLLTLANTIRTLQELQKHPAGAAEIEFVLPDPSKD